MTTTRPTVSGRLQACDGLRALAALSIFLFHTAGRAQPSLDAYVKLLPAVRGAVHIFFVLSGFLLYRPIARAHRTGAPWDVRTYARNRVLRIFPAYWVALLGAFFLGTTHIRTARDWLAHLTLTHVFSRHEAFVGPAITWTLSVEVSFYIALPLYHLAIRRFAARHGLRAELAGAVILALIGAAWWWWYRSPSDWLQQYWLPWWLPSFASGIAVAGWMEHAQLPVAWQRRARSLACGAVVVAVACLLEAARVGKPPGVFIPSGTGFDQMLFTISALMLLLSVIVDAEGVALPAVVLGSGPVVAFGRVSYGFYLWHVAVLDTLHDHVLSSASVRNSYVLLLVVAFVVATVVGALSWYGIESPALRLRRRPMVT